MKNLIKILSLLFLAMFCVIGFVSASETGGTLSTGLETGISGTVVVAPSASPVAGTYTSAQNVSLSATGSQSVHYTIDGSNPTCSTGSVYSTPIAIASTTTLKAIACYPNSNASNVSSFAYTINEYVAPPGGGGGGGGSPAPAPASVGKPGDTNGDNNVDELDFAILMAQWSQIGSGLAGDLNKDNVVDEFDFAILMANWGK